MNQIGWCLEQIQIIMGNGFPRRIESNDEIILAKNKLNKVVNLCITLEKVISDKKFKKILYKLENQSFEGIKFQAEHIEKLFKNLQEMLDLFKFHINDLNNVLDKRDKSAWEKSASDIPYTIVDRCSNEYYELKSELKAVLHTKEQLKELFIYEEHLEHFLE